MRGGQLKKTHGNFTLPIPLPYQAVPTNYEFVLSTACNDLTLSYYNPNIQYR